jgi:hypothetical protein
MTKRNKCFLAVVFLTGTLVSQVKAQALLPLITINDSNPNAVTFTGTGANATASTSSSTYAEGLLLTGFSPTNLFFPTVTDTGSSLIASVDGTPDYTSLQSGSVGSVSGVEISGTNLAPSNANIEDFVAGSPAFGGSATFDLNGATFSLTLPADGTTGDVYTDTNGFASPVQIGTYVVDNAVTTPEPATMGLMLMGALGLVGVMRARSRASFGALLG